MPKKLGVKMVRVGWFFARVLALDFFRAGFSGGKRIIPRPFKKNEKSPVIGLIFYGSDLECKNVIKALLSENDEGVKLTPNNEKNNI